MPSAIASCLGTDVRWVSIAKGPGSSQACLPPHHTPSPPSRANRFSAIQTWLRSSPPPRLKKRNTVKLPNAVGSENSSDLGRASSRLLRKLGWCRLSVIPTKSGVVRDTTLNRQTGRSLSGTTTEFLGWDACCRAAAGNQIWRRGGDSNPRYGVNRITI